MTVTEHVSERQAREVAEQARETQWRQPSFAKELFLGRLRLDLVHPHPSGPPEAAERGEAFLAKLRDFCESQIDAAVIERDGQIPDEVVRGLKELGAFGMKIASQVRRARPVTAVLQQGARAGRLGASLRSARCSPRTSRSACRSRFRCSAPRSRSERSCPGVPQEISAFLLTEPDVGCDPARVHATATPDGDDYVLDGVKLWTTNGVIADLLVVMAQVPKSEGHRGGITAFVVEADAPGITVENRNAFMGLRGIENGVTRFHQVRVPAANRHRPRGRRAEDRADHAQHRAAFAAGAVYRRRRNGV